MTVCGTCGVVHLTRSGRPACTAHSRGRLRPEIAGKACRNNPRIGQRVCGKHGGDSETAIAAAARRLERERAEALMMTLGAPIGGDPAEIVLERIAVVNGHVQWLRERVKLLTEEQLTWGKTKTKTGGDDAGITEEAKPHIWHQMYAEWSARLERLCLDALRYGIKQREIEIAKQHSDRFLAALDEIVRLLGHDPAAPETANTMRSVLRLIVGGQDAAAS